MNRPELILPTRAARLRKLLTSPETSFIMEAHNGLSARIVEEAGFQGIWGSGLTISSQFGVRDNNEASWTQIIELLEFMSDASSLPILLDGDTGYGNFNNVRRLVRKLCQRGIACQRCNRLIGIVKDDAALLRRIADGLEVAAAAAGERIAAADARLPFPEADAS